MNETKYEDLEKLGQLHIERMLGAGEFSRKGLADAALTLAGELRHHAMDLGMSKATEFSPWIWRLDLVASKLAFLALGPAHEKLHHYEGQWGVDRYHGTKNHGRLRSYHQFRIAYLAGEGLLDLVQQAWGWALQPVVEVVALNLFGNVLVTCEGGSIWRICLEDLQVERIGDTFETLHYKYRGDEPKEDWLVTPWVEQARETLGPLEMGQCYGFDIWPALGGSIDVENMSIKPTREYLALSGDVADQIKDLPDGAKVEFKFE